jgi:hypothetical protein
MAEIRLGDCKKAVSAILHVAAAIFVISAWQMSQTFAQDGHAEHHDEYQHWKQPGSGLSCCNDQDCRPTRAYLAEEGWRAWDGNRWLLVPPAAVLKLRAKDGRTHLCANPDGHVYCFAPADPRS